MWCWWLVVDGCCLLSAWMFLRSLTSPNVHHGRSQGACQGGLRGATASGATPSRAGAVSSGGKPLTAAPAAYAAYCRSLQCKGQTIEIDLLGRQLRIRSTASANGSRQVHARKNRRHPATLHQGYQEPGAQALQSDRAGRRASCPAGRRALPRGTWGTVPTTYLPARPGRTTKDRSLVSRRSAVWFRSGVGGKMRRKTDVFFVRAETFLAKFSPLGDRFRRLAARLRAPSELAGAVSPNAGSGG